MYLFLCLIEVKSLSLDLKDPKNLKILIPILKEADIIIEQFRPGVMKRLGLDYESVKKINQDVIYVSITGYGQYGPKSQVAGHDLNYIGNAGLLSISMGQENDTVVPPALVADIAGGSYPAVINILLALRKRELKKEGSYIDLSMTENLFPFMFWGLGSGFAHNKWPGIVMGFYLVDLQDTISTKLVMVDMLLQHHWRIDFGISFVRL